MADKLVVVEDYSGYRIQWELEEERDWGACLGDYDGSVSKMKRELSVSKMKRELEKVKSTEDRGHLVATLAVLEMEDFDRELYGDGFLWGVKSRAFAALRVAKAAIKADKQNLPLPDWAKKAIAEGWKIPKGWLP